MQCAYIHGWLLVVHADSFVTLSALTNPSITMHPVLVLLVVFTVMSCLSRSTVPDNSSIVCHGHYNKSNTLTMH